MYQVFFSMLLATGCRIGELCALTWKDIDFEKNRIHIWRHFVQDHNGWHIDEGCKTTAGERWLYMDNDTMNMLMGASGIGSKMRYSLRTVITPEILPSLILSECVSRPF